MAEDEAAISLKPSVNNMSVRVFVRAAGLDFTEADVYGSTRTPEFLATQPRAPDADAGSQGPAAGARCGKAAPSCSISATSMS